MNVSIMECRHQRLLQLVSASLFISSLMMIDFVTALSHLKANGYGSSSTEGVSLAAERCGCMIGPAGPPGVPGVPGKLHALCTKIRYEKDRQF